MPPVNDDLANATDITATLETPIFQSTVTATQEADEGTYFGYCTPNVESVWLKFQAPAGVALEVSVANATPGHHPYLQLFEIPSSTPSYPTTVTTPFSLGDGTDSPPDVVWPITEGQWYIVYVGTYDCPPSQTVGDVTITFNVVASYPEGWSYDGNRIVRYTTYSATPGQWYRLFCNDPDSSSPYVQADSATMTIVTSDVGGLPVGVGFNARVHRAATNAVGILDETQATNVFQYGTATDDGAPAIAEWTYDGDKAISVEFIAIGGVEYILSVVTDVQGSAPFDTVTGGPYSDGSVQTLNLTMANSPSPAGFTFWADLEDNDPPNGAFTIRTFTGGVAGEGVAGNPLVVSAACTSFGRFYESPPWRFVVGDLEGVTTTWLDKLATDLRLEHVHLGPSSISGRVPSDNPEIYITADDGDAFLEEGDRLCWAFERSCGTTPWEVRMAGVCLSMEDDGGGDAPTSRFTFYDSWELLRRRPVLLADGSHPGQAGRVYPAGTRYDEIIIDQLDLMATYGPVGGGVSAFAFCDWGQTAFYGGTIEATAALTDDLTIQQGKTIGDLLDDLVASGEVEPVFDAIYDPMDRPGYTHELSIYVQAGAFRPAAVMAWDLWGRSLAGINRLRDGRERINRARYNAGQGGIPFEEERDTVSLAKFGDYFVQQFFPGEDNLDVLNAMILRTLALQAEGKTTYRLAPAAARAPIPFSEYDRGDFVPVYASERLRRPIEGERLRVQAIPIAIGEDQLPRIAGLLVSNEYAVTT